MNLYLLAQTENRGYDTYDSAVVSQKVAVGRCLMSFLLLLTLGD